MLRKSLLMMTALTLTGCLSVDSLKPGQGVPKDTDYYLVDIKYRFFCLGTTNSCRDMTKIVSAQDKLAPIEQVYGAKVKGPNYPVSLTRMVLNPPDDSYQNTPVGTNGRYFKIPINDKTKTVWRALGLAENDLYQN